MIRHDMTCMNGFIRDKLPGKSNTATADILLDTHEMAFLLITVKLVFNRNEMHLDLFIVGFQTSNSFEQLHQVSQLVEFSKIRIISI